MFEYEIRESRARNQPGSSTMEREMNRYQARITESAAGIYALIVRVDYDGEENVIHGYKGRYFSSRKAADKSTAAYIAKHCS